MNNTFMFKPLELSGKIVKFKLGADRYKIYYLQDKIDNYCMKVEYGKILHNADIVYNFLLENRIPRMDTIKALSYPVESSADISAERLASCEVELNRLYSLNYLNENDFIDIWRNISQHWYSDLSRTSGYRCHDLMQITLDGIRYTAPNILDIRRNMIKVFEQNFECNVLAAIVLMYMVEYISPFSVMTGVMARSILYHFLRVPGVQICKELYINSHEYKNAFLDSVQQDEDNTIDITKYFDFVYSIVNRAYDKYLDKITLLSPDEESAYKLLLKTAEKTSYIIPVHLAVVSMRLACNDGVEMLNALNRRGRIEFTDSNNIIVYKRSN